MPDRFLYDYAIIRVVPKVEREEFINVGAIVSCGTKKFLEARIEIDEQRLMAIDSIRVSSSAAASSVQPTLACMSER